MHLIATFVGMNSANRSNKLVATWLLVGVVMTIIQFVLGGVTRLTGSGLSITEWEVITGALPPLSEQAWLNEFAKYKQTPQFQLLNFEFDLQNFKYICKAHAPRPTFYFCTRLTLLYTLVCTATECAQNGTSNFCRHAPGCSKSQNTQCSNTCSACATTHVWCPYGRPQSSHGSTNLANHQW